MDEAVLSRALRWTRNTIVPLSCDKRKIFFFVASRVNVSVRYFMVL